MNENINHIPKNTHPQQDLTTRIAAAFLTLFSLITLPAYAASEKRIADLVMVPIPTINVTYNTCLEWQIEQTYTATAMPVETLSVLEPYGAYSTDSHFHAKYTPSQPGGHWETTLQMNGTVLEKLAAINKTIFGTEKPVQGTTKTISNHHIGGCAQDQNLRECVGIFVSPQKGEFVTGQPTTFPDGMCSGIPPAGTSCYFEQGQVTIDLGTGAAGSRHGETVATAKCTRPTDFYIRLLNAPPDDASGIQQINVLVNKQELPAQLAGTSAGTGLTIEVTANVSGSGPMSASRVLQIDVL